MKGPSLLASTLLLLGFLLGTAVLAPAEAQEEAREMSREESQALEDWARGLLDSLSDPDEEVSPEASMDAEYQRLWALYFLAVEHSSRVDDGRDAAAHLLSSDLPPARGRTVEALAGALEVTRAKHSRWPPNKLKYLRAGMEVLDGLVSSHGQDPGIRYLRLVSCYYLPFFLQREESVKEDLEALIQLLPLGLGAMPGPVYEAAIHFVLDKGTLGPEARKALEGALG